MRPKGAGVTQHYGGSETEANSNQAAHHGNHAGQPIFHGARPFGASNGNGKFRNQNTNRNNGNGSHFRNQNNNTFGRFYPQGSVPVASFYPPPPPRVYGVPNGFNFAHHNNYIPMNAHRPGPPYYTSPPAQYPRMIPVPHLNAYNMPPPVLPLQPQGSSNQKFSNSYGNHRSSPALMSNKPRLFVNPTLISPPEGELLEWKNGDGYSEFYAPAPHDGRLIPLGFHSQQIGKDTNSEDRKTPNTTVSSAVLSNSNTSDSINTSEQNLESPRTSEASDILSTISTFTQENVSELQSISPPSEENGSSENQEHNKIGFYKFNGINFPMISRKDLASSSLEHYGNLMNDIGGLVKAFFRKHPDMWELADSTNRIAISKEDHDETLEFNDENCSKQQTEEETNMVKIDYFVPEKPIRVPREALSDFEQGIRPINKMNGVFEKCISDKSSLLNLQANQIEIKLDELERLQVENIMQSGQQTHIIMYTEFPGENDADPTTANQTGSTDGTITSGIQSPVPTPPVTNEHESQRSSRLSDFTNLAGNSNRGRSSSNLGWSSTTRKVYPRWSENEVSASRQDPQSSNGRIPGTSHRRLPEIPAQFRNNSGESTWAQIVGSRENEPTEAPLRRRHQSQDSTMRVDNGRYRQSWTNDHTRLRFIIPTETEFMARVPFPPYRIPLIGVARRNPGKFILFIEVKKNVVLKFSIEFRNLFFF
nr:hypothetical protein T20F7.5 - Caenorhabditis elegans [Caenorhabditis elegans]